MSHWYFGMMGLVLLSWFGWQQVKAQGANWLPVNFVRIEGALQYISKEKIKPLITAEVMSGLVHVDVQRVRRSVEQLPWVRTAQVKRVWPDVISISIKEQNPTARWGDKALLNQKGQVFEPDNIKLFRRLPLLNGPSGNEKKLLLAMDEMEEALMDQGMILTEFRVDERRAWKLVVDNKIEVKLGRNKPKQKFSRFLKTFALIGEEQIKKVAVVDLRYANGYAVTWKQGEDEIDWKHVAKLNKT